MTFFVMFWGRDGRELYIGPHGTLTRDATEAAHFERESLALAAFKRVPRGLKHRHLVGCKVRSRRRAPQAA